MHDWFACIDSQAMSNIGYVVQLEVSTLTHARNLGRHIHAAIHENADVSYGLLERYVTSTHVDIEYPDGGGRSTGEQD